ncbi:S8 family peptidase [Cohnella caldifontis]|uniref:S8 family peptidase n=1 Tax=Cohnella caldifontis TaxID=3027471 RepID=UPI0023EBBE74|nr:S8 family peptidase [Cohnella sp. YIM B05605]
MRHKAWIAPVRLLSLLAAVSLVLPSCSPGQRSSSPSPQASRQAEKRETNYKETAVRRDMEATERLNRQQNVLDAHRLMAGLAGIPDRPNRAQRLSAFLKQHPEIVSVTWIDGTDQAAWKENKTTTQLRAAAAPYLKKAGSAVKSGKSYVSPSFNHQGRRYFVMGEPAPGGKSRGVAALVSASVVQEVERHQRRNLRLIPYPAEGRYRIESVKPNTNQDVTVRKGSDNANASHYAIDEAVVKFRRPLTAKELLQIRKDLDVNIVRQTGQIYVFRSRKHQMQHMQSYFRKWNPIYAEPHYLYLTNETDGETDAQVVVPNDTLYSQYQWNLPQIETEQGWNLNKGSQDVVVAVVDTGVQSDHPDLKGRLVKGYNVVDPSSPPEDDVGHGTHVAGIIAAQVNNDEGVAGLTWYTKIMPVKALDSSGSGSTYSVAEGVIWAADHGADVINMSLGNYAQAQFLHDAIQYAHSKGAVIVAASGNDNTDRPGYPAAYPEVLAVAATDQGGAKAEYSNFGDYIDVAAPGTNIASTYPGSRYAALSGTSMASPHVAALASLVRAANPNLKNTEVMDLLRKTAVDLGDKGKDNLFGYGQIDIVSALRAAGGGAQSLQLFPERVRQQLERLGAS